MQHKLCWTMANIFGQNIVSRILNGSDNQNTGRTVLFGCNNATIMLFEFMQLIFCNRSIISFKNEIHSISIRNARCLMTSLTSYLEYTVYYTLVYNIEPILGLDWKLLVSLESSTKLSYSRIWGWLNRKRFLRDQ